MNGPHAFGLYIHIPFCDRLCHYCDFAKTARFDDDLIERYLARVGEDAARWTDLLKNHGYFQPYSSVFFGGGTPGVLGDELGSVLARVAGDLTADAEISLEANPRNISDERLKAWRRHGFNRLSIGIQTFQSEGLKFLTRDHGADEARLALDTAARHFTNLNADLIYGWPGQTLASFEADLTELTARRVPHVCLYNLTYASGTPLGRRKERGRLEDVSEDHEAALYEHAVQHLARAGYEQDEVSNWSLPGFACRHNYLYWQGLPYLGVGAGAHGFLGSPETIGGRYALPTLVSRYLTLPYPEASHFTQGLPTGYPGFETRDEADWLLEYVGCGLRARSGLALARIEGVTGSAFSPTGLLTDALADGRLTITPERHLRLDPKEWFRETTWAHLVASAFRSPAALL